MSLKTDQVIGVETAQDGSVADDEDWAGCTINLKDNLRAKKVDELGVFSPQPGASSHISARAVPAPSAG
jgi:hypothetical protein